MSKDYLLGIDIGTSDLARILAGSFPVHEPQFGKL